MSNIDPNTPRIDVSQTESPAVEKAGEKEGLSVSRSAMPASGKEVEADSFVQNAVESVKLQQTLGNHLANYSSEIRGSGKARRLISIGLYPKGSYFLHQSSKKSQSKELCIITYVVVKGERKLGQKKFPIGTTKKDLDDFIREQNLDKPIAGVNEKVIFKVVDKNGEETELEINKLLLEMMIIPSLEFDDNINSIYSKNVTGNTIEINKEIGDVDTVKAMIEYLTNDNDEVITDANKEQLRALASFLRVQKLERAIDAFTSSPQVWELNHSIPKHEAFCNINSEQAEERLKDQPNGTCLIRYLGRCSDPDIESKCGEFVISFVQDNKVFHCICEYDNESILTYKHEAHKGEGPCKSLPLLRRASSELDEYDPSWLIFPSNTFYVVSAWPKVTENKPIVDILIGDPMNLVRGGSQWVKDQVINSDRFLNKSEDEANAFLANASEGAYFFRPSSQEGYITLSFKQEGKVNHKLVLVTEKGVEFAAIKDHRLLRDERKPKSHYSNIVTFCKQYSNVLQQPFNVKDQVMNSRADANALLANANDGTYFFRPSSQKGHIALSFKQGKKIMHMLVLVTEKGVTFAGANQPLFKNFDDFCRSYSNVLKQPLLK